MSPKRRISNSASMPPCSKKRSAVSERESHCRDGILALQAWRCFPGRRGEGERASTNARTTSAAMRQRRPVPCALACGERGRRQRLPVTAKELAPKSCPRSAREATRRRCGPARARLSGLLLLLELQGELLLRQELLLLSLLFEGGWKWYGSSKRRGSETAEAGTQRPGDACLSGGDLGNLRRRRRRGLCYACWELWRSSGRGPDDGARRCLVARPYSCRISRARPLHTESQLINYHRGK